MTSAGMQFVSSSYIISLAWSSLDGVCSWSISLDSLLMYSSQSGSCTVRVGDRPVGPAGFCTLAASSINKARLRLRSECIAILFASSGGHMHCSFFPTEMSTFEISSCEGEGTLMPRQRDRTGSIIFDAELQMRIIRHWDEYLQIVGYKQCYCVVLRVIYKNMKLKRTSPLFFEAQPEPASTAGPPPSKRLQVVEITRRMPRVK